MGKKKRPFYRLVVLDNRRRRDGAYLANLGYYNPFIEPHEVKLHGDEIIAWLKKGATVSGTAKALLRAEGILYRYSLIRQGLSDEEIATQVARWQEGADARTARRQQKLAEEARQAAEAKAKAAEAAQAEAEADETPAEAGEEAEAAEEETAEAPAPEPEAAEPAADAATAEEEKPAAAEGDAAEPDAADDGDEGPKEEG